MRILKINPLLKLLNNYLVDSAQPSNLNYLWNFGSLLAFLLTIKFWAEVLKQKIKLRISYINFQVSMFFVNYYKVVYIFIVVSFGLLMFLNKLFCVIELYMNNTGDSTVFMNDPGDSKNNSTGFGNYSGGGEGGGPQKPNPSSHNWAANVAYANENARHTDSESDREIEPLPSYEGFTREQLEKEFYDWKKKNMDDRAEIKKSVTELRAEMREEMKTSAPSYKEREEQKFAFADQKLDAIAEQNSHVSASGILKNLVKNENTMNNRQQASVENTLVHKRHLLNDSVYSNRTQAEIEFAESKKHLYRILDSINHSTRRMEVIADKVNKIYKQNK